MIFITAKFRILPEDAERWPEIAGEFTRATRAEPGCLWFDWSRSLDDPTEYVLVEAFRDGDAGARTSSPSTSRTRGSRCRPISPRPPGSSTSPFPRTTGRSSASWPCAGRPAWPATIGRRGRTGNAAIALLARLGIAHSVHIYDHDPRRGAYGLEASDALGVAPERVFKTLVAEVDGALTVGVVPVAGQLDLKALAAAAGGKRAAMADVAAAERATGYVAGGISPLGQRKRLPVVVDSSALGFATIFCSGGRRGLEIELAPADLVRAAGAVVAAIAVTTRQCGA